MVTFKSFIMPALLAGVFLLADCQKKVNDTTLNANDKFVVNNQPKVANVSGLVYTQVLYIHNLR